MKLLESDNEAPSILERINPYLATNPEDRDSGFFCLVINVKMAQKNLLSEKVPSRDIFEGSIAPKV